MDGFLRDLTGVIWDVTGLYLQADITITLALSIVTAGAGAFAGALAAQSIVQRSKLKDEVTQEIRNVNAAIALSYDIVNAFLAIKDQHIMALSNSFQENKNVFLVVEEQRLAGEQIGPINFEMDLQKLPLVCVPYEALQNIVFNELSLVGRPLNLVAVLGRSLRSYEEARNERTLIIGRFQEFPIDANDLKVKFYFGQPDEAGHVDTSFEDNILGIRQYSDDCIWFAVQLSKDLQKHGEILLKNHKSILSTNSIKITTPDYTNVAEGMIPLDEDFANWQKAFE